VPYDKGQEWIDLLKVKGPERWLLRKLQRFSVNIYKNDFATMLANGWLSEVCTGVFALVSPDGYDLKTGLVVDEIPFDPDKFTM